MLVLSCDCTSLTWTVSINATHRRWVLFWINHSSNCWRKWTCTATCFPSQKLSKLDENDMLDLAGDSMMLRICDILLWNPIHGHTNVDWLTMNLIHQLFADTRCRLEDRLYTIDDWDRWWLTRESVQLEEPDDDNCRKQFITDRWNTYIFSTFEWNRVSNSSVKEFFRFCFLNWNTEWP